MNENLHVDDPLVAAVLAAAAAPAEAPMPGEAQALAAFRHVHRPSRRLRMISPKENLKLFAAAVFGGVVMISGAASAAVGELPLVSHHNNTHATTHTTDGTDDDATETADTEDSTDTEDSADAATATTDTQVNVHDNGQGSDISTYVHSLPQGHKGAQVCVLASGGKCSDGQAHGQDQATTHGQSDATTHGQSDATTHGKADATTHGQSDATTHGKAGATVHGNAGTADDSTDTTDDTATS